MRHSRTSLFILLAVIGVATIAGGMTHGSKQVFVGQPYDECLFALENLHAENINHSIGTFRYVKGPKDRSRRDLWYRLPDGRTYEILIMEDSVSHRKYVGHIWHVRGRDKFEQTYEEVASAP